MKKREIKPLPFIAYYFPVLIIVLIGLGDATYLSISHCRNYTDIGYKSFCAVSKAINCDTVSQSPYSILFQLPVAIWGILGYLFVLCLVIFAWRFRRGKKYIWPTLFFISLVYSIGSIALALVSSLIIRSYCIMCILSWAVNLALLFYSWLIFRRFEKESLFVGLKNDIKNYAIHTRQVITFLSTFAVVTVFVFLAVPEYWNFELVLPSIYIPTGLTKEGYPWIGAENPELTIIEFSDYQCFQCKKMHFYLRQLIAENPNKLRLIHRQFPMDHLVNPIVKDPFHVGSGKLSLLALFALEKNKFWMVNDKLFQLSKTEKSFNLRKIAAEAGFNVFEFAASINRPHIQAKLIEDIRDGLELGITGTPGFVIEGNVFLGSIPDKYLSGY
jgi:uncharacterized membrane protein